MSVKRLDLNLVASLAFRIGYDAYPREMRRLSTTNITSQTLRSGEREYFRLLDDWVSRAPDGSVRFILSGFTPFWTLSSKFFSTFPRGTCSLSVSWSYLVLGGVYLPLRAALSSNPTLKRLKSTGVTSLQASHLLWGPVRGSFRSVNQFE